MSAYSDEQIRDIMRTNESLMDRAEAAEDRVLELEAVLEAIRAQLDTAILQVRPTWRGWWQG